MIIPDVNILIHAHNVDYFHHEAARSWWEATLYRARPVGLAWAAVLGFIRIVTNRSIVTRSLPVKQAVGTVRSWLELPGVRMIHPGEEHGETLFRLLEELGTAGNLTTDAHLAALAIEYQAEIATTDADFSRFPGLRWFNPVAVNKRRR